MKHRDRRRTRGLSETMTLLWASHSRQIGRTGLTINDLVDAAIALAVRDGAAALSIRNLATELDVRPMAMYSVIPGKEGLEALMVDRAYRELYPGDEALTTTDWRKGLTEIAHHNRALHNKHPWLHELLRARSPMGPYEARKAELELQVIENTGLTEFEMDGVLALLHTHVVQSARLEAQLSRERVETGLDDVEWWGEAMPVLQRVFDPKRFPLCVKVGTALSHARDRPFWGQEVFEFGLHRILDGIAALIASRTSKRVRSKRRSR